MTQPSLLTLLIQEAWRTNGKPDHPCSDSAGRLAAAVPVTVQLRIAAWQQDDCIMALQRLHTSPWQKELTGQLLGVSTIYLTEEKAIGLSVNQSEL